ncbi:MAG: hypothetical protein M1839_006580 [Geoglossum umbratile]|nr:MAG: hypothetical protein M1839_006580 [Geoglossum umbratile]
MPVTVKPSPELVGCNVDFQVHSAEELLAFTTRYLVAPDRGINRGTGEVTEPENRSIIQSSFRDLNHGSTVIPYNNGLVNGIIRAFQQDLHLVLRPDDIWLSILTQFSIFVNANAEHLRGHFVAHKGKKDLTIDARPSSVEDIDMGKFAQEMTLLIHKNVVDAELRDWVIPSFSTTTDNDKSVAAIVMMGTLKKYFNLGLHGGCGFPSVTLLGERSDWEEILRKVKKLPKYGDPTAEWSRLLAPIIEHMIASFDQPNSQRVKDFWLRACHFAGQDGSAEIETLSGWITAFCFWWDKGPRNEGYSDELLSDDLLGEDVDRKRLILDGIPYPIIHRTSIPKGVVSVPVTVQDFESGLEHATTIIAGSVGVTATAAGGGKDPTTVQPKSGWWMLEDSVRPMFVRPVESNRSPYWRYQEH